MKLLVLGFMVSGLVLASFFFTATDASDALAYQWEKLTYQNPVYVPTELYSVDIDPNDLPGSILKLINVYRATKGLSSIQTDTFSCAFAQKRLTEIKANFSHEGFKKRLEGYTMPYPNTSILSENIARNIEPVNIVPSWIQSEGHRENLEKDTPFGCIAIDGEYVVFEGWKP